MRPVAIFFQAIATAPPLAITVLYLLFSAGGGRTVIAAVVLHLGWAFGAASIARNASGDGDSRWHSLALVAALCGALIATEMHWVAPGQELELLARAVLFAGGCAMIWLQFAAARAIELAETNSVKAKDLFGTFLLIFFLPIGVWWLRKRLVLIDQRVAEV